MAFVNTKNGRLHYETLGEGRPIILIHGFTNFGLSWAQQVPELVHSGYRVILPDLYGHGQSQPAEHVLTVPDLTYGIVALMDQLAIDNAVIGGLSLGGMVAQQLAVDFPQRVEALIIANSRATFAEPGLVAAVSGWIDMFLQPDGPRKRLQTTWPIMLNESYRQSAAGRATLAAWTQVLSTVEGSSLANVAKGMTQFDLRDRIGTIHVPTLVISGEHDKLFPPVTSREVADGIPGASFQVIAGAAHISSLDSPDAFNALVRQFLCALCPVRRP
jgi:3-oxoadipate enol-lactonase